MADQHLPTDSAARKDVPLAEGLLYYFPAALAEVARVSKAGNDKHNPGQPMHHARGKSNDHADCIVRHLIDAGTVDPDDGQRHSAKVAWRALALLQEELEREAGAPLARNAKLPEAEKPDPLNPPNDFDFWHDNPKRIYRAEKVNATGPHQWRVTWHDGSVGVWYPEDEVRQLLKLGKWHMIEVTD